MIIVQLGLCCRFVFPLVRFVKDKVIYLLYYTVIIPFVVYLLLRYKSTQPILCTSYGAILIALVTFLWTPTIYARYLRGYWGKFATYRISLSLLIFFLYMVFCNQRLVTFFVFFELSLVPIMAILFLGGKSDKKLEAGLYIFAFTRSSSFLFLVFLVFVSLFQHGFTSYILSTATCYNSSLDAWGLASSFSCLFYNLATIVILVKTPVFFVHIWLPKAHVEAPVFASIILARLLLKTGGYGYLVLYINFFRILAHFDCIVSGVLLFSILAAIRCSAQADIKILIAYSSVNHIGIMLCGIIIGLRYSVLGGVILIVGHGIISSVLFFLARDRYNQIRTRRSFFSLILSKGNLNILSWLRLTLINAGLPPFLMFIGEVIIFKAILLYPLLMFLFFLNYILIGYYSCSMLIKLMLSKFPSNVGTLIGVGLNPFISCSVVFIHLLVLINISITNPWLI